MKSKLFLAVLLLTPLLVVLSATLFFQAGFSPKYTKNNGVLFNEYFDVSKLGLISDSKDLKFDDGKWIFAIYAIRNQDLEKALYLMRQLNIALNRDINKLKRVVFSFEESHISDQLIDYPRTEIIIDPDDKLFFELLREDHKYFDQQKIFLIDPYGRAVMYFPVSMDPKLILKDLKVLI
tara:strand:+ start:922 stop:1458 length:537 start_codon:yes stop_codon:yes gene_type:complete